MVTELLQQDATSPPMVMITDSTGEAAGDAAHWASENRHRIAEQLHSAGAILFRDFGVATADDFNRFVEAISGPPLEYRERSSPRSRVAGNIYTSTDYPPEYPIFLHNESSYSSSWPLRLFFYCQTPAASGGATPIADTRHIVHRVDPSLRRRFEERGVMYVRNFGPGLGLSWATAFQTEDRAAVEEHCRRAGIDCEWLDGGRLRTRHVRPAIARHPASGLEVWFNHATFFHVTTLEPVIREFLLASYREDELPNNTYYGDGTAIEPAALDELRALYTSGTVAAAWHQGDVMLVDNMLTAHGRAAYTGARKVLVAMTEQVS